MQRARLHPLADTLRGGDLSSCPLVSRHDGNHRKGPIFRYAGSFQIRGHAWPLPAPFTPSLPAKLEADAISAAQDAFIGARWCAQGWLASVAYNSSAASSPDPRHDPGQRRNPRQQHRVGPRPLHPRQ